MNIPEEDNVARYCKPSVVLGGIVSFNAFQLNKSKNEEFISVHWLEFYKKNTELENLKEIYNFQKNIINYDIKDNGAYALMNVKEAKELIKKISNINLLIKQITDDNPKSSHSGIFNTSSAYELAIAENLASLVNKNKKVFSVIQYFSKSKKKS